MPPSPKQLVWRSRLESVLRLIEPGLDLMLAAGDRLSRVVSPGQLDAPPPARRVPIPTPTRGYVSAPDADRDGEPTG